MGIRLSLAGALLVAIFVALRRGTTRARATALAAAILPALTVFLPFVAAAPRNFLFGVWQYHAVRAAQYQDIPIAPTWMAWWTGKLVFAIEATRGFPLPFLALALGLLAWRRSRHAMGEGERTLLMIAGAVTLVSMLPHPVHATYVAVVMPLVSMIGARLLVAHLPPITVYRPRVLVAAGLVATSALVLPRVGVIREWRPGELDGLRTGARRLEATLPPGPLVTFENAMNVEMGRPALPGLEMGPFAFWPYLETERARSLRVVNRELLCAMIADRPIAAVLMRDRERYLLRQSCGDEPLAATMVGRYVLRPELRIERFGQYGALEDGADALNVFTPLDPRATGPVSAGALAGQSDPHPRPDRPAEQIERQ
jgi:hypothetical protein